jgi:SOUL heme-binding protein
VAYQIQTDILPSLTAAAAAAATASSSPSTSSNTRNNNNSSSRSRSRTNSNGSNNNNGNLPFPTPPLPNLLSFLPRPPSIPNTEEMNKISTRFLNTVTNQIQKNIELFQSDLQDPSRIPTRMVQQAEDILTEASNVFAETPIGLQATPYTILMTTEDFEIRDYPAYTVATTTMSAAIMNDKEDNDNDYTDPTNSGSGSTSSNSNDFLSSTTDQGMAFNTLASYLFGANDENRVMEMTTPVTTTMSGEMRFYIPTDGTTTTSRKPPPGPLSQDASIQDKYTYDTTPSKIRIEEIPPARLAVRRFTGFVTNGEIQRQKDALLSALRNYRPLPQTNSRIKNTIEIDTPHGQPVKHVIFQYNPPYTLPVLRRNEIAVPITILSDNDDDNVSP